MAIQRKRSDGSTQCSECYDFEGNHRKGCSELKPFPIQGGGTIPWWLAEEAYIHYAKLFPSSARGQSLERMGERGGFGIKELLRLLRREDW